MEKAFAIYVTTRGAEEHEIDREWLDEEQVGQPPFLYVQVTWDETRSAVPDVDDLVERYALRRLTSVTPSR